MQNTNACNACQQCQPRLDNYSKLPDEKEFEFKNISPWVFVTHNCTCACPYCMIPKIDGSPEKNMTSETFRKMLEVTEKLLEKKIIEKIHFRLSGGEPLAAFHKYKDIVTEYRKKYNNDMTFGILTNGTIFTDEIADWMNENKIGTQVSLDDLISGKPLKNGQSSSEKVLANIQKMQRKGINFAINTVLDITKTKDLTELANFVISFKDMTWGLNASYTETDENKIKEVIDIFDKCIFQLVKRGFDIYNKLRFYNTIVGKRSGGCSAGVSSFAIGTNLEVWSCQTLCDGDPLGIYSEDIKERLETSEKNKYYYNKGLMRRCVDCPVLGECRGGCRSTHSNIKINDVVCRIRINILTKIMNGYYHQNNTQNCSCNEHNHDHGNGINKILETIDTKETQIVDDTPLIECE